MLVFGILIDLTQPENILLVEEGSVASIKVIDFGLARILKDNEDQYEAHGTVEFVGKVCKIALLIS